MGKLGDGSVLLTLTVKSGLGVERGGAEAAGGLRSIAEGGRRTGILIIDLTDASDIPRIAEPWFLALNASIEATPFRHATA